VRRFTKFAALVAVFVTSMVVTAPLAHAAAFTAGNIVVYRVGDGTAALANTGNAVFLDEYTPTGTLVQSIPMPTVTSGANHRLVASGTATSEGLISRSADGAYVVLTGYDSAIPAGSSLSGTASATVPRTVGRVNANGTVDTTTALTDFSTGNNPRGVASNDGSSFYVTGGAGGVRYATLGATTSTQLSTTQTNLRGALVAGGDLYVSTQAGSTFRVGKVGSGLPTTSGQTIANLTGLSTSSVPNGFVLLDLDPSVAGVDTLYVADDTTSGGQILKYALVSGSWTAKGAITAGMIRGLTASVSGTTVTLFGTTSGSSGITGTLFSATDASGFAGTASGTASTIATAPANEAFRGVALAPTGGQPPVTPEAPLTVLLPLSGLAIGGAVWLLRRRSSTPLRFSSTSGTRT
jgi:hypothetical protein